MYFNFLEELTSIEKFKHDVEGVFGLKDLDEFHVVGVVETANDVDFFYEAFFAVFLAVGCLLGKGFDCAFRFVLEAFNHVDSCKVALSDLFDGLELLMETHLIDILSEVSSPFFAVFFWQLVNQFVFLVVKG